MSNRIRRGQKAARMRAVPTRMRYLRHVDVQELRRRMEFERGRSLRTRAPRSLQNNRVLRERPLQTVLRILQNVRRPWREQLHLLSKTVTPPSETVRVPMRRRLLLDGATIWTRLRALLAHVQNLRVSIELYRVPRRIAIAERRVQVLLRPGVSFPSCHTRTSLTWKHVK